MPERIQLSDRYRLAVDHEREQCVLEQYRDGFSISGDYCGKSWHTEKSFTFAEIHAIQQIRL